MNRKFQVFLNRKKKKGASKAFYKGGKTIAMHLQTKMSEMLAKMQKINYFIIYENKQETFIDLNF